MRKETRASSVSGGAPFGGGVGAKDEPDETMRIRLYRSFSTRN
jgi:hypothetical protein